MKKVFIILICIFCSSGLLAQDLIVTVYGDSILCKITKVTSGNVYFTWKQNNEYSSSYFPRSGVKSYKYNFSNETIILKEEKVTESEFKPILIAFDGGFSFTLARLDESIPDELTDYYQDLKTGANINAGITYYLEETLGIGIKYQCFMTSNYLDNAYVTSPSGSTGYGVLSDHLRISFYGPSITFRTLKGHHPSTYYLTYYAGYARYMDDAIRINPYKITGNTIAMGLDAGIDLEVAENFAIGFQASFLAGGIRKFKVDDGNSIRTVNLEKGSYESLYRIDLSIGLRLKL
jgi:hypothetical protein